MDAATAAKYGMAPHELVDVLDSPAGLVLKHSDGTTYIDVPADTPDAEGKSGLMFLVAPSETYDGSFPVFAQPDEEAEHVTEVIPAPKKATAAKKAAK